MGVNSINISATEALVTSPRKGLNSIFIQSLDSKVATVTKGVNSAQFSTSSFQYTLPTIGENSAFFDIGARWVLCVQDESGNPIENASILLSNAINSDTYSVTTDTNGKAAISLFREITTDGSGFNDTGLIYDTVLDISQSGYLDFNTTISDPTNAGGVQVLTLQGVDCINPNPLNKYNFFRWQQVNGSLPLSKNAAQCERLKVNPHIMGRKCLLESKVYTVPNEVYYFYQNFVIEQNNDDYQSLVLALVNERDYSIAHVFGNVLNNDSGNLYASFQMPLVGFGMYRLIIYDALNSVRYIGNLIAYMSEEIGCRETSIIESSNFRNRLGFNYELSPDIKTVVRLALYEKYVQPTYETEETVYKEITTGKIRSYATESEKIVKFQFVKFDHNSVDALQKTIENSFFTINGTRYSRKGNLSTQQDQDRNFTSGEFEAYEVEFSELNNNDTC